MLSKIWCNENIRTNSALGLTMQVTFFFMCTVLIWLETGNETPKYAVIKYYIINTRVYTVSVEFLIFYTSQFTAKLCRNTFLHETNSESARARQTQKHKHKHTHTHISHENRLLGGGEAYIGE